MNNIISQDFWCVTLTKEDRECVWQHNEDDISHHLMIEQVVLGLNCKERCMVEATSNLIDGTERSTMICQLIPSAVPNCKLSLSFKQVKLRLAAGDGPVYLTGTHSQEIEDIEGDSDDEVVEAPQLVDNEAEEESEEESSDDGEEGIDEDKMMEELAAAQASKLKTFMKKNKRAIVNSKPGPLSKKADPNPEPAKEEPKGEPAAKEETAVKKDEPMEEIDTPAVAAAKGVKKEDEEESDDEEESGEDDDEDDDDDQEVESDEDDEEEEDDDDEDEDESEEESEEEAAPVTKKRKTDAPEPVAVKNNANGKLAATPKQSKKPQTPAKPNLNELKKKLLASPGLPKKYAKFVNLMKNAHKVTDDKEIKNTWEFLQKNKK